MSHRNTDIGANTDTVGEEKFFFTPLDSSDWSNQIDRRQIILKKNLVMYVQGPHKDMRPTGSQANEVNMLPRTFTVQKLSW